MRDADSRLYPAAPASALFGRWFRLGKFVSQQLCRLVDSLERLRRLVLHDAERSNVVEEIGVRNRRSRRDHRTLGRRPISGFEVSQLPAGGDCQPEEPKSTGWADPSVRLGFGQELGYVSTDSGRINREPVSQFLDTLIDGCPAQWRQ